MARVQPRLTRTDPPVPYTALFRSAAGAAGAAGAGELATSAVGDCAQRPQNAAPGRNGASQGGQSVAAGGAGACSGALSGALAAATARVSGTDRKSTRLNSSH